LGAARGGGARRTVLQFPGGLVDEGEAPADAAQRELLEETGYAGAPAVAIGKLFTLPGSIRNCAHFFAVRNAQRVAEPKPEAGEQITVALGSLADLTRALGTGALSAMPAVCTYTLARQAFPDLPWE
jgi:8-oxo-dGTP pyrophosphatase MutT (NUDIX family)